MSSKPDTQPNRPPGRARVAVAALVPLIVLIPIAVALTLGAPAAPAGTTSHFTPLASASASAGAGGTATATTPTTTTTTSHRAALKLPGGSGTLVALVDHATPMRTSPGGRVFAQLTTRTNFGSVQQLWVARVKGRWLGVVSTLAGNNRLGWIPAADATLGRVDWELKVSLHARRLTVMRGSHAIRTFEVAVGRPTAPTPSGRFAVTDRLVTGDPGGPYGCCILALSAKAPHSIQDWSGGDRIAIHSTPETSSIGQAVSHGCLRLSPAAGQWLLDHIPAGTPTLISS